MNLPSLRLQAKSPQVNPVRILIDGFSVLHACKDELPATAPHTAKARDWLLKQCLSYQDTLHIPMSVFFDGKGAAKANLKDETHPHLEVIYSASSQTADALIERVAHRLLAYGKVLVITNDQAEQSTILSMGGEVMSCEQFMEHVRDQRDRFEQDHARYLRQDS